MKSWLKAGLIGGIFLGAVTITTTSGLFFTEYVNLLFRIFNRCVSVFIYSAIGVLAVHMSPPRMTIRESAIFGAYSGLFAGIADNVIIMLIWIYPILLGGSDVYFSYSLTEKGTLLSALIWSIIFVVLSATTGALGGVIYSKTRKGG